MKNSAWITVPYAHSLAGQGPESWEPLERHGQEVARMAAGFAAAAQAQKSLTYSGTGRGAARYGQGAGFVSGYAVTEWSRVNHEAKYFSCAYS